MAPVKAPMKSYGGPLYELDGVGKAYQTPGEPLTILRDVRLTVEQGESLAILGASGSGKTTLLHILGALDEPTSGQVRYDGRDVSALDGRAKAALRNAEIGFVFQFHHLLPEFTTRENVAMPALIARRPKAEALKLAEEALEKVGLAERMNHPVTRLSGGERQRAAIARAILMKPRALLADEPTGNLDEKNGARIGSLLASLNKEIGMTLVVVTHNQELAKLMQRRLELRSGELYAQ